MADQVPERNLLQSLINVCEKASNIARLCRSDGDLLSLLVQDKNGREVRKRFNYDFKALAEVLIHETIKYDLSKMFPEMRECFYGEEPVHFTNKVGESTWVKIGDTIKDTTKCLTRVLNGKKEPATVLANEVHREVMYNETQLGEIPEMPQDINYADLDVWIDPINGTLEYICGDSIFTLFPGITSTGLDCVTILIGVVNRSTGEPIMGVISQPFHQKLGKNRFGSYIYWGVALPNLIANNCCYPRNIRNPLSAFCNCENSDSLQCYINTGYEIAYSAGVGHKSLKVITYDIDMYMVTKDSTYKWDTCATQAILRSLNGNIYDFSESVRRLEPVPLNYSQSKLKCNDGGIIYARDSKQLKESLLENLAIIKKHPAL